MIKISAEEYKILPNLEPIIRGTFLGWRLETSDGKKIQSDNPTEIREHIQKNRGTIKFYSRFTNGEITEVQPGYNLKDIPNTPAYKSGQLWIIGMPTEDVHQSMDFKDYQSGTLA